MLNSLIFLSELLLCNRHATLFLNVAVCFRQVVMILYFGKSALNPFIYGWKNRDFRLAFARLLRYVPCSKWAMERSLSSVEMATGIGSRAGSIQPHDRQRLSKIYQLELPPIEWQINSTDLSNDDYLQRTIPPDQQQVTDL